MKARIAAGLALLAALSACGQVGSLYLPEDEAATTVPAATVAPGNDAGATGTGGTDIGNTDPVGTDAGTTAPDRTNESRRRAP
jgi:predicted small lipoprotein YifL